jgi:hypothetical protein
MPNAPEKSDPTATPSLTVTDTGIAPYVYFEGAPNFGFGNGIISITLAANRHLLRDGAPVTDAIAIAHLRCNVPAAIELRSALDAALLLAARPRGGPQ